MNSITIITIVVVALLALVIGGLCWLAFSSSLKMYRLEVNHGLHDDKIKKEYDSKKKNKWSLLGLIGSWVILVALFSLFVTGIVYKASGQVFSAGNKVSLVIKSGSMSDFYNDEVANKNNNDRSLQFDVGDICSFEKISSDSELIIGDVYGYKRNDMIITHRLVAVYGDNYQFRGDNNSTFDGNVTRDKILYHYTGEKVKGIGSFVLFAQSYFGIISLAGVVGIMVLSEIAGSKVDTINKIRAKELGINIEVKKKAKVVKAKKPKKETPKKKEEPKAEEPKTEEVTEENNDEEKQSDSNASD